MSAERKCQNCGAELVRRRADAIYCGVRCRVAGWRQENDPDDRTFRYRGRLAEIGRRLYEKDLLPFDLRKDKDAVDEAIAKIIQDGLS